MDELGTEPGQAGREAAGSGRRRAGARTDSGREGSPRLATQVTSSPAALGTVQKRPDPRSRGSLTPRVPEPRGRVPQELRSSGSRLPPPFPRAPSWREIAARLLRNSNINSNSSPGSADKVTALQRLGLSLSAAGSAPLRAPLPPPGGGQSRGRAVGAGPPPAGGSPRSPPRARGLLSFPAPPSHAPSLSSSLAAAGRMLTTASSATARALTASPTSRPSAWGAASGRARCRSWPISSTSWPTKWKTAPPPSTRSARRATAAAGAPCPTVSSGSCGRSPAPPSSEFEGPPRSPRTDGLRPSRETPRPARHGPRGQTDGAGKLWRPRPRSRPPPRARRRRRRRSPRRARRCSRGRASVAGGAARPLRPGRAAQGSPAAGCGARSALGAETWPTPALPSAVRAAGRESDTEQSLRGLRYTWTERKSAIVRGFR